MSRRIKSIVIILFIVFLSIIIFGCSTKYEHINSIYTEENITSHTELFKETASQVDNIFEVDYFRLSISEKGELTDCTVYGNKIYYIFQFLKKYSNIAEISRIYEYDTITGKSRLIYEIEDPDVLWVNELRADEKKLYWTTLRENKYTLESLDLKTQRAEKIHSVSNEKINQPIVLGGNNKYLSWYEYDVAKNLLKFMYYNLKEEEISYVNEEGIFFDTFDRPSINKEKALILQDVNSKISFNLFNLKNFQIEHRFSLSKEMGCVFPQVSNEYIVWRDKYSERNIYVYNLKLNNVSKINLKELDKNIFSMHLYDRILYINTGEDIMYFDLEETSYSIITKASIHNKSLIGGNYSLSKISLDKQYISLFRNYPEYYVFIVKYKK